jgi:RNA polymerase sigma-70 factor, ECF subfamily
MILLLPRLRRFARALAGTSADADDLVQATCERALRSLGQWTQGTRLDSWMFRIMRNHHIDEVRKHRIAAEEPLEDKFDLTGDDGRAVTEGRLELASVRDRIAALPEDQRAVLVLVCVEDMSYRDAAEILEIPIGTVMSRLSRARLALMKAEGTTARREVSR